MSELLTRADEPETRIQDVELAHEMALTSDWRRTLGVESRRAALQYALEGDARSAQERIGYSVVDGEIADAEERWVGIVHQNPPSKDFMDEHKPLFEAINLFGAPASIFAYIEQREIAEAREVVEAEKRAAEDESDYGIFLNEARQKALQELLADLSDTVDDAHSQCYTDDEPQENVWHYIFPDDLEAIKTVNNPNTTLGELKELVDAFRATKLEQAQKDLSTYEPILEVVRSGEACTYSAER